MLFLVKGNVNVSLYMNDSKTKKELRLVEAGDGDEAVRKFTEHFERQSEPYGYSYYVFDVTALETIT